jgi:outer membrane receptor for ferrienterochelin and colicin
MRRLWLVVTMCLVAVAAEAVDARSALAEATLFGTVSGIVRDPQSHSIQGADVTLRARSSAWSKSMTTDAGGTFRFIAVPLGDYSVTVTAPGFAVSTVDVTVISGTGPVVPFQLPLAPESATVTVKATPEVAPTDSATPITLINRTDIERTPGADRTNSLGMITDYVPGAYITHDMLHIRGGHQTLWLLDGVPVVNTAIAANVGPQFDPNDIDYLESNRGSYGAEVGDRTYGVFNVVPRSGFERNNDAELTVSAGNFQQTNDDFSVGGHTNRFAYYTSVNGNHSDLGLQTPVPQVVHDAANGGGGFGSLIFNKDASNQLRLIVTARHDSYQIPFDPDPNDIENGAIPANGDSPQYQSIGLRDVQRESDAGAILSWVHTVNSQVLLTISPFYHYNSGNYGSAPTDVPVATTEDRGSTYAGAQASLTVGLAKNSLQMGGFSFYQRDSQFFGATFNDGSGTLPVADTERPTANLETFFIEDRIQPTAWLTFTAGMRPTRFSGNSFTESALSPRLSATATVPRVRWTLRAFYGRYYQAPPLETASGPSLLNLTGSQGLTLIPLHGEFDEEYQYGVAAPVGGWVVDADHFRTNARNFLDHNNIGDSSIFFPLTVSQALIRATEVTLRSPRFAHRGQVHLAYSHQTAEGSGTITGGLTDFTVFPELTPLDHDQRNTLSVGGDVTLPGGGYASANISYGSGFHNAFPGQPYPGDYLPANTTVDLAFGKDFGQKYALSLNVLNVTNERVELDNSLTFGGFHWNNPREVYVRVRYRFHY